MSLVLQRKRDIDLCAAMLRRGSVSFHTASLLLPAALRKEVIVLYAFCRSSDDAVDEVDAANVATSLARLHTRVQRIYEGTPEDRPEDRAMVELVRRHMVPRAVLEALLEGFAWDAERRTYNTIDDLHAYGVRVAGTVGIMMSMLMGVRATHLLARACDLGVAMQLTNIARDVGQDARMGRIYLPLSWMQDAGLQHTEWLASPKFSAPLGTVTERLLGNADELYARAAAGIEYLPKECRHAIRAALLIYQDIGRKVRANRFDSVSKRAVVPFVRKVWLMFKAHFWRMRSSNNLYARPLPGADFLLSTETQNLKPRAHSPSQSTTLHARSIVRHGSEASC